MSDELKTLEYNPKKYWVVPVAKWAVYWFAGFVGLIVAYDYFLA
jgi:hypothetical protein